MMLQPKTLELIVANLGNIWGANINDPGGAVDMALAAKKNRRRFFFIGNGGSAAIASHMAADWLKNGNTLAMCFNDAPLITALANDYAFRDVFTIPLLVHANKGDVLFAISSSGASDSILYAVVAAKRLGLNVITLSGFKSDNPLRKLGDINFYIPSDRYGVVEVCHHAICHAILDEVIAHGSADHSAKAAVGL